MITPIDTWEMNNTRPTTQSRDIIESHQPSDRWRMRQGFRGMGTFRSIAPTTYVGTMDTCLSVDLRANVSYSPDFANIDTRARNDYLLRPLGPSAGSGGRARPGFPPASTGVRSSWWGFASTSRIAFGRGNNHTGGAIASSSSNRTPAQSPAPGLGESQRDSQGRPAVEVMEEEPAVIPSRDRRRVLRPRSSHRRLPWAARGIRVPSFTDQ